MITSLCWTCSYRGTYFCDVTQSFPCRLFLVATFLAYFSTLKMEAVRSSETSVNFYQTTRHYIPEDSTPCY
jgi:hypothetical protein